MKKSELKQMVREEIQATLSEANVAKPYAVIDVSQKGDPIVSAAFESEIAAKKFAKLTNLKKPNTNHVVKKLKVQVEPGQKIGRAYAFRSLTVESELRQIVREELSKLVEASSARIECMECGKKFKAKPTPDAMCPRCGSMDLGLLDHHIRR